MTLPPLNGHILTKNEDIKKVRISAESHAKGLQNDPLTCLDRIKIEQDINGNI
jgi:hypothetical protein